MHHKPKNGANLLPETEEQPKYPVALLLGLSTVEKKAILYQLLCNLFGDQPREEVWIYDPEGELYGHFLPPELRSELQFLQNPEFAAELDRRGKSSGPTVSFKDVIKDLTKSGK